MKKFILLPLAVFALIVIATILKYPNFITAFEEATTDYINVILPEDVVVQKKSLSAVPQPSNLVLSKKNTLVFRGVVSDKTVGRLLQKAMHMSSQLKDSDEIFLVMDSPGGYIHSGLRFIHTLQALPQKVNTITLSAASMGSFIVQALGTRYATPDAELMFHRAATGGMGGQFETGELETRLNHSKRGVRYIEAVNAKRMGMTLKHYKSLVINEYWVHGFDAVKANAVDQIVNITCDKTLQSTSIHRMSIFIFEIDVTFSNCPAINGPLDWKIVNRKATREARERVEEVLKTKKFELI